MRNSINVLALSICCIAMSYAESIDDAILNWQDEGRAETLLSHDGYLRYIVYYSGQCPSAASTMKTEVKAIHDMIENEHLPVTLVLVTPDRDAESLKSYAEQIGCEEALFAEDKKNAKSISLNNILQSYYESKGKSANAGMPSASKLRELVQKAQPTYRFPVSGLENPLSQKLWWMIERGQPGAVETLIKAAKRSSISEDAQSILAVVDGYYQAQASTLLAAEASMDTFEKIEAVLKAGAGLDLKALTVRHKELSKSAALKDEIKAKMAFEKIVSELEKSGVDKRRAKAPAAFLQLAEYLPNTKYGKLAAKRATAR